MGGSGGRLAGRTAIITGASRGIGAATARAFAAEGAAVALVARSRPAIEALAVELAAAGARAEAIVCDVADPAAVAAAAARTTAAFGRIDVLIANAAVIEPIAPLAGADPAAWGRAIAVNVTGVFNCLRATLPVMRAQRAGTVVTVGSGAATTPLEGWSAYCASKAGVLMLMRCAHLENRGSGINVFSLSPGTVATDMQARIRASGINPVSRMEPSEHAPPEEPARALVWLCTPAAARHAGEEVSLRDPAIRAAAGLA